MEYKLSEHFSYGRLIRYSIPSIVMMVFTSMYTIVDGLFVSNLAGDAAFASLNLIWPVIGMLSAFGFMVGTGGAALVSKTLGEKKKFLACEYFTMLIAFEILTGIVVSVITAFNIRSIARMLGATDDLIQDCVNYGFILLLAQPFVFVSTSFQSFLVTAEKPKAGLWITVLCGISNMVFDYVFIAWCQMGIFGAALATALGWVIGSILPLFFFVRSGRSALHFVHFKWHFKALGQACLNGSSEMVTNLSASFVLMLYNFELMHYIGSNGVNAYGVIQYITFLFSAVFFGYNMAAAPLIGFQYGAQNHRELKSLTSKSLVTTICFCLLMTAIAEASAGWLSHIFVSYSATLMELTVHAIHLYAIGFLMAGFNIFASGFFTALNNGVVSAILSFMRTFVFQAGCILLLPLVWGIDGIWLAVPVSEGLSALLGVFYLVYEKKRYGY